MSEKIYRGVFRKTNGKRLRMDFYAESRPLALSHAACVASDTHAIREHGTELEVVRVTRVAAADRAGEFVEIS